MNFCHSIRTVYNLKYFLLLRKTKIQVKKKKTLSFFSFELLPWIKSPFNRNWRLDILTKNVELKSNRRFSIQCRFLYNTIRWYKHIACTNALTQANLPHQIYVFVDTSQSEGYVRLRFYRLYLALLLCIGCGAYVYIHSIGTTTIIITKNLFHYVSYKQMYLLAFLRRILNKMYCIYINICILFAIY